MERVWMVCPSSERIVQDIKRFPTALQRIIEAKGAKCRTLTRAVTAASRCQLSCTRTVSAPSLSERLNGRVWTQSDALIRSGVQAVQGKCGEIVGRPSVTGYETKKRSIRTEKTDPLVTLVFKVEYTCVGSRPNQKLSLSVRVPSVIPCRCWLLRSVETGVWCSGAAFDDQKNLRYIDHRPQSRAQNKSNVPPQAKKAATASEPYTLRVRRVRARARAASEI